MKTSLNWIKEYINLDDIKLEDLVAKLNLAGLEVEAVEPVAQGSNLIIGKVLKSVDHPESDHLHICEVDIKEEIKTIVCGAPNVAANQFVIVALPGAVLPAKGITIKEATVRGVKSSGMICSLLELGVSENLLTKEQKEGIEVLNENAVIGDRNPLKFLNLDDIILDLKITPNRGDCLSVIGIVYEIAAILDKKINYQPIEIINYTSLTNNKIIIDSDSCPKFSLKRVSNIEIKDSPKWLKDKLDSAGINSINNIVDIGNYVMLLLGTPLHIYDGKNLDNQTFTISDNCEDKFMALNEKSYQLEKGDLLIKVGQELGCIAGIIGGKDSSVTGSTKEIIIESAVFEGTTIRKTSKRLELFSESSTRFSRGVNHQLTDLALQLAANLILETCPDAKIYQTVSESKIVNTLEKIDITLKDVNKLLGTDFQEAVLIKTFNRLNLEYSKDKEVFKVEQTSRRSDLKIKQDLIEEIIRLEGFENLVSTLPNFIAKNNGLNEYQKKRRLIREFLIDNGLSEVMTYTLGDQDSSEINKNISGETLKLLNSFGEETAYLRTSLMPSLLKVAGYNLSRQNNDLAIFELSNVYTDKTDTELLSGLLVNNFGTKLRPEPVDFYLAKGIIQGIFDLLGLENNRYSFVRSKSKYYHPYRSADVILEGKNIGTIGEINYLVSSKFNLSNVVGFEINLKELLSKKTGKVKYTEVNRYPKVIRDIAIVLDKKIEVGIVIKSIKKSGGELVSDIQLFDIYTGNHLEENKKSLAISITFVDRTKTLVDVVIKENIAKILKQLEIEFNAKLRV